MSRQPVDELSTDVTSPLVCFEAASPTDVVDALSPVFVRIINASLSSSVVPHSMKHAAVIPVLKKRDYDVNELSNCRPISNISFVAKTAERFVARQLQHFLDENDTYAVYQSAYRPRHNAETALLRIHNDVAQSIDARRGVLLVLLELSAAFDTPDHAVMQQCHQDWRSARVGPRTSTLQRLHCATGEASPTTRYTTPYLCRRHAVLCRLPTNEACRCTCARGGLCPRCEHLSLGQWPNPQRD